MSDFPSITGADPGATIAGAVPLPGEERLESLRCASPLGIGGLEDDVINEANQQLADLTGIPLDGLVGYNVRQLFARAGEFERLRDVLQEQLLVARAASAETCWLRPDGKTIEVLLTVSRLSSVPGDLRWTFTALDLTARREAAHEVELCQKQLAGFHAISTIMQDDEPGTKEFNAIAREVGMMTGFPVVAIELCDFERSVMIYCGSHGVKVEGLPEPPEIPMDVTPSGQVAVSGESLVETEAAVRRECAAPFFKQFKAETFVCVPIKANDQVVGALSLAHRRRELVLPRTLLQIQSVANYLATMFGRLRARQAVRKGEAELAAVYDRAPSVMCLLDEQLRVVRANRAAKEFTLRGDSSSTPMSVGRFLSCSAVCRKHDARCGQTSQCACCELRRAATETFQTGKGWHQVRIASRLARKDRNCDLALLVSTARLRVDGTTRVLLCIEDITQNELADEKIRSQAALLDVARDAIIVRDFADKISYWNEGAHRLYGWTAAEAVGRTVSELLLGAQDRKGAEAFQAVQEREDWSGEMQHLNRAGDKLVVQSRWTLVRDREGTPKGILLVNSDLTEKKRLESQLLRAQRLESIGTLASGLAHDLNNVLAPIMMSVHMLKDEARTDSMRTCLDTLEACAQRGSDIVSQVLMFARGVEGARVPVHPKHLMGDTQRIVRETFPRSIRVESLISRDTPLVECDATQLQQVLMNLCVNARDAMQQGGKLTLRSESVQLGADAAALHPRAHAGKYAVLSVTDTGTGIPQAIIEKIFDPFFTTKPLGHGTGLGLPIVMGIAENHGGFVVVESTVGVGTSFRVYLPAAVTEQEKIVGSNASENLPQGNGEKVLVVDDEPAIRRIVDVILSRNGYSTVSASDGMEAVVMFQQEPDQIAFVVCDLMMPHQDGPATIRAIRRIKDSVRVVAITGLGEEGRISEAKAAGADSFLKKPFTASQLLHAVKELATFRIS